MADTQPVSPLAHGTAVFAGVLMIIGGAFQARRGSRGHCERQVPRGPPGVHLCL
jgi:hypothetical protein